MKKTITFVLGAAFVLALGFVSFDGHPILPKYLGTPGVRWAETGTITATQATLAVGARDYSAVWTDLSDAKTVKWDVPQDASGIELRFQTTANADAQVLEMWIASGDTYWDRVVEESFMLGGTFTLTGGQQVGPNSNVFCDTMVATEMVIHNGVVRDSGNDRVSVYRVDLRGYKKVIFIATTFEAASTIYVDARWY